MMVVMGLVRSVYPDLIVIFPAEKAEMDSHRKNIK